jgi:tripartite-type tricarboxylate transporter receptor subunit TctC
VIVPFGPGGGADLLTRIISTRLTEQLGVPFIVENRPGAGGITGNAFVAKAAPDGYTLMLMDSSATIVPALRKSLPFDVAEDFTPIVQMSAAPLVLAISPSLNVNSLAEFVALARANPGKFNYGSAGIGTLPHLAPELFNRAAKVNIAHIPYKGGGEIAIAMLSGQVQMVLIPTSSVLTFINSGKMRALAITAAEGKRLAILPDVPSMKEAGVPDMVIYQWHGLVGPPGMPKDVVDKLRSEVVKALAVTAVRDAFLAQGAETVGADQDEFGRRIRSDLRRWAEVVKAAGITPE